MPDLMPSKKGFQGNEQILGRPETRRDPDEPGVIEKFPTGRKQEDFDVIRCVHSQVPDRRKSSESSPRDNHSFHGSNPPSIWMSPKSGKPNTGNPESSFQVMVHIFIESVSFLLDNRV